MYHVPTYVLYYSSQRRGSGRRPEPRRAANFRENGHKNSTFGTPSPADVLEN